MSDGPDQTPGGGHGKHGLWAMVACCIPMILVLVLIALRII